MLSLIFSFLILAVPAYLLTRLLFEKDLLETLAITIGFAIVLSVLSGFFLNFLVISTLSVWGFNILLSGILLLLLIKNNIGLYPTTVQLANKHHIWILILVLVFSSALVYYPRNDYAFPNHLDEWNTVHFTNEIIETGHLFSSPFRKNNEPHLETGTHIFLAEVFLLTGADPILDYKYLPAIFMFLTAFEAFICVHLLTKKFWAGILTVMFLVSIESNINLLGIWFFTPFTMAFPLVFLFMFLFSQGVSSNDDFYVLAALFLVFGMITFHASTAIMLAVLAGAFLLVERRYFQRHIKTLASVFGILILAGIIFAKAVFNVSIFETLLKIFWHTIPAWNQGAYNYPVVYGMIATFFVIPGLWVAWKSIKLRLFVIFWSIELIYYLLCFIVPFTLYIENIRIFYLLMLISAPLSALGVYKLIISLNDEDLQIAAAIAIIVLVAFTQFSHYFYYSENRLDPRQNFVKYIDKADYEDLLWLKESSIKETKILAKEKFEAVMPLTGNFPVTRIVPTHTKNKKMKLTGAFFKDGSSCKSRSLFLKKYKTNYVLSDDKIDCSFLKLRRKGNLYLYGVDKNELNNVKFDDSFERSIEYLLNNRMFLARIY